MTTLAGSGTQGSADGVGTTATFGQPNGVAYAPGGTTALVADTANNLIRKIELATLQVTTLAGTGSA